MQLQSADYRLKIIHNWFSIILCLAWQVNLIGQSENIRTITSADTIAVKIVNQEYKYGLVDLEGDTIYPCIFDKIKIEPRRYKPPLILLKNHKMGMILTDWLGEELIAMSKNIKIKDSFAIVESDNYSLFHLNQKHFIFQEKVMIWPFEAEYFIIQDEKKKGRLFNFKHGTFSTTFEQFKVLEIKEKKVNTKKFIIGSIQKEHVLLDKDSLFPFSIDTFKKIRSRRTYGFLIGENDQGEKYFDLETSKWSDEIYESIIVKKSGNLLLGQKWAENLNSYFLLKQNGDTVSFGNGQKCVTLGETYVGVKNDDLYKVFSINGTLLFEGLFDRVSFNYDEIIVHQDGKSFAVDSHGVRLYSYNFYLKYYFTNRYIVIEK